MSERTSQGRAPYVAGDQRAADAELHRAIDRAYDKAETFVSGLGRMLGADTSGAASSQVATGERAALAPSNVRALPPAKLAEHPFEIVEVMSNGVAVAWLVTNGCESARCESKAIADAVLDHLQKATSK